MALRHPARLRRRRSRRSSSLTLAVRRLGGDRQAARPARRRARSSVGIPSGVLALFFLLVARVRRRRALHRPRRSPSARSAGSARARARARVLIVGAGDGGRLLLREIVRNPQLGLSPVGFVDDDPLKLRVRIDGVKVLGTTDQLPRILDEAEPDEMLIAIPSAPGTLRARVARAGRERGIPVRTMPTVFELLLSGGGAVARQVREVQVEDVLGREPVRMELDRVGAYLSGEVVLVTGAGGSIGSELCRQIARVAPRRLILRRPRRGQPLRDPARARGRPPRAPVVAGRGARRLQGGRADARGVRRAPADDRLPRGRLQARRADGGQPGRGGAQQRDRHAARRAARRRDRRQGVRARLDRQGGVARRR